MIALTFPLAHPEPPLLTDHFYCKEIVAFMTETSHPTTLS